MQVLRCEFSKRQEYIQELKNENRNLHIDLKKAKKKFVDSVQECQETAEERNKLRVELLDRDSTLKDSLDQLKKTMKEYKNRSQRVLKLQRANAEQAVIINGLREENLRLNASVNEMKQDYEEKAAQVMNWLEEEHSNYRKRIDKKNSHQKRRKNKRKRSRKQFESDDSQLESE